MSYDPVSVAAEVAVLAARADDLQFTVVVEPTSLRALNVDRYPAARSLLPLVGQTAYVVCYAILYRRVTFGGGMVVSQTNVTLATGLLAEEATFQLALYDLRNPVTEYTPGGRGVVSGP
jgi:hypothetical protein